MFGLRLGFPTYNLTVFMLPLLYGAWRFTVFHALAGPVLANYLTKGPNDVPIVWYLFSIAIFLVALAPWLMRSLKVERWHPWPER